MASEPDQIGLIMQLRRRGIRDTRVLRAIELVPRELFVDPAFVDHAYQDIALPIDCGQTISQPYVVAFMTEKLKLEESHKVLEIGTGSGYQAAVLSHLCRQVFTVERWRELQKAADRRFAMFGSRMSPPSLATGGSAGRRRRPRPHHRHRRGAGSPAGAGRPVKATRSHDHPAWRDPRHAVACRDR